MKRERLWLAALSESQSESESTRSTDELRGVATVARKAVLMVVLMAVLLAQVWVATRDSRVARQIGSRKSFDIRNFVHR